MNKRTCNNCRHTQNNGRCNLDTECDKDYSGWKPRTKPPCGIGLR